MSNSPLTFDMWDIVEVQGSYVDNEWRVCDIDNDNKTVHLVSKFDREIDLPFALIIGKVNKEGK